MEYSFGITEIVNFNKKTWKVIAIIWYWFASLYEDAIYFVKNNFMA